MSLSRSSLVTVVFGLTIAALVLWLAWPATPESSTRANSSAPVEDQAPLLGDFGPDQAAPSPAVVKASDDTTLAGADALAAIQRANPKPADEPGSELPVQLNERVTAGGLAQYPQSGPPLRIAEGKPIPELFPHQKERLTIETLASTYDVANLPAIAGYLTHQDPLVRDAARLGLIQLSRPEAAPVLRAAAEKMDDKNEAAALLEAAEFLAGVPRSS